MSIKFCKKRVTAVFLLFFMMLSLGLCDEKVGRYPPTPAIPDSIPSVPLRAGGEKPEYVLIESVELNAFATYYKGRPYVIVTDSLNEAVFAIAYYEACVTSGGADVDDAIARTALLAVSSAIGNGDPPPPPPYVPAHLESRVLKRAKMLYERMIGYVILHEIAHHALGHVKQAYRTAGIDPSAPNYVDLHLKDLFRQRVIEIEADTAACSVAADQWGKRDTDYSLTYFCRFMAAIEEASGGKIEFLSSHPKWENRLAWMRSILQSL